MTSDASVYCDDCGKELATGERGICDSCYNLGLDDCDTEEFEQEMARCWCPYCHCGEDTDLGVCDDCSRGIHQG
jgi:hypothetical protein